jgi:hypothetical protein
MVSYDNKQAGSNWEDNSMLKPGTRVKLTKGYKDVSGTITQKTDSPYEIYVVDLDNGISIVVGPSAFIVL